MHLRTAWQRSLGLGNGIRLCLEGQRGGSHELGQRRLQRPPAPSAPAQPGTGETISSEWKKKGGWRVSLPGEAESSTLPPASRRAGAGTRVLGLRSRQQVTAAGTNTLLQISRFCLVGRRCRGSCCCVLPSRRDGAARAVVPRLLT